MGSRVGKKKEEVGLRRAVRGGLIRPTAEACSHHRVVRHGWSMQSSSCCSPRGGGGYATGPTGLRRPRDSEGRRHCLFNSQEAASTTDCQRPTEAQTRRTRRRCARKGRCRYSSARPCKVGKGGCRQLRRRLRGCTPPPRDCADARAPPHPPGRLRRKRQRPMLSVSCFAAASSSSSPLRHLCLG